ncbi:uncharacterized protein [Macrobrachium rosenbergii]|uniref:uncharacterized protein n=1 Tax=Macrobrachium rosenbergii TaxID=79674 RepID=UPI0034D5D158
MASSSGSVSSPKVLKFLKLYYFVTHWGKEVVYKICNLSFLRGTNQTILEILNENQVPLQRKKTPFNPQEIKNLSDKLPKDLDITVMNKICQTLWDKGVNDPGGELRGLVVKIKDERNSVSHEAPDMSDTELESKLRDYQAMFAETLAKAKSHFPSNYSEIDKLETEIQEAVPKLLEKIREKYDPLKPQDVQGLKEEIEEFGSEFSDMILNSSETELLSVHERHCQILPYHWLAQYGTTHPGDITVCLKVEHDQGHGNESISVNQNEILNEDKMGKDSEVVIISGDEGSGKTTILCSCAEAWCKKTNDIPELSSFPFLLYMQFQNDDHDNFDDYLKNLIPKTIAIFPFDLVKSVVLGSKCLVLCDGYDEANGKSRKLFDEMLALNSNTMKYVVTTRPGKTMELTDIVNKRNRSRINLKVSGLQEEDTKLLTEKLVGYLLKNDVTQQEQIKNELLQKIREMNTDIRAILQTPLYFNLFILLYIECPDLRDKMGTWTSVYLQLRKHRIKRISNKTGISEESLEEFDALYKKWSLQDYIKEKREWSDEDVTTFQEEIICPEVRQNLEAIMSSYFSVKNTKKDEEIVKVYCHRQVSEQEFAAASSICDDIVTTSSGRSQEGGNVVTEVLLSRGLCDESNLSQLFLKFGPVISLIPEILYSTERDVLYDTIHNIHELYVSCSLSPFVVEGHDDLLDPSIGTRLDDKVLESLASQMRNTSLRDRVEFREPKSLCALPSLLLKLKPKEVVLDLSLSKVPGDLSQLNQTLYSANQSDVRSKINIRMCLREYAQLSGQGEVLHPVDEI